MIFEEIIHNPGSQIVLELLLGSVIAISSSTQDKILTNWINFLEMKLKIF